MKSDAIAALLADSLPGAHLLTGADAEAYAVSGVKPAVALQVQSPDEIARLLELANEHHWSISPRGGGTMLDLGNPITRLDVAVDLRGMDAVVDYQPEDLTLTVQAGITAGAVHRVLAERGQMLPWDVPLPDRATLGGALATNVSGPRRLRYGTARDLVIGMQAALPGIGLARSGGKVVKNVAGYDLAKLHVGGLGTAGIITEVTFKLAPAPVAGAALLAAFETSERATAAAMAIVHGRLFPAAVDLVSPSSAARLGAASHLAVQGSWTVAVLSLGLPGAVERQSREIAAVCAAAGAALSGSLDALQGEEFFGAIRDYGRAPATIAELIVRASVLPLQLVQAVDALTAAASSLADEPEILARPGSGTVLAHWPAAPVAAVPAFVRAARTALRQLGGGLVVERAPGRSVEAIDSWGLTGGDLTIMRSLKRAFDPLQLLNPGRFVAGI